MLGAAVGSFFLAGCEDSAALGGRLQTKQKTKHKQLDNENKRMMGALGALPHFDQVRGVWSKQWQRQLLLGF